MSILIEAAGMDRQELQRLFDSLWYDVLGDELVGRESARRAGIDVAALRDQVAQCIPDATLSEVPTPIKVAQRTAGPERVPAFVVAVHQFWPCAASGVLTEDLAKALDSLLHRFLVPEVSLILRDRGDTRAS